MATKSRTNPKLSIIIISKQEEAYLPKLLESIKNQSFKDYELILSDAQSTDKTRTIARKYGCKIIEGGLPSTGRNNGAKVAKGDILLFLDADAIMTEKFIEHSLDEMNKKGAQCAIPLIHPYPKKYLTDIIIHNLYNLWIKSNQKILPTGGGVGIFCDRNLFKKVGGFNTEYLMGEDHRFLRDASKHGKFKVLKSKLLVSVRRLDKHGRVKLISQYIIGFGFEVIKGKKYVPPFDYELQGGVNVKKIKKSMLKNKVSHSLK